MQNTFARESVLKNVLRFSLPYLLSYFLQTLYGMADLLLIGQFDGVAGTTAVSIGSQVMHMVTVMLVGLAMGITVGIGHAVGAGENPGRGRCGHPGVPDHLFYRHPLHHGVQHHCGHLPRAGRL